jgi:hypothetical protein
MEVGNGFHSESARGGLKNDNEKIKGISVNHRESIRLSAEGLRVTKTPLSGSLPRVDRGLTEGAVGRLNFLNKTASWSIL